MAITASNSSKPRELVPAGVHIARCFSMLELGTIPTEFNGDTKIQTKVIIGWELPEETKVFNPEKGEQPFVISKEYTLSMNEKATLRHDLESWRGQGFTETEAKEFDITKLLGVPCMINVIHKISGSGNQYSSVSGVMPLPKKTVCPKRVNPMQVLSYDNFNYTLFESLPDFIKDKIKSSRQYKELHSDVKPISQWERNVEPAEEIQSLPF